ncbi:MAG: DUF1553 domain-containing protein [Verrucomicrobiales bacterium]|nr:DUF1553 domain-containing protein [Verrucomicrobiales bacterium]
MEYAGNPKPTTAVAPADLLYGLKRRIPRSVWTWVRFPTSAEFRRPSAGGTRLLRKALVIGGLALLPTGILCAEGIETPNTPSWWAFRPISSPAVPSIRGIHPGNPVDAFLAARLAERGLTFSAQATPRERLRRLHFDLVGLPPTPEEVAAFERDPSPAAWVRQVDALLARPQYGERWARHWLDVVRFAQSNGYERDSEKLYAWRYRDYVVQALNRDLPYDRFVREQIAGDELAREETDEDARDADIIATGFLRLGVHDDEPDDKLQAEYDELDDVVSTCGATFLGLTVGCARCHDHKFDPIPQQDYYSLLAVFRPLRITGKADPPLDSPLLLPLASPDRISEWTNAQESRRRELEGRIAGAPSEDRKKALRQELDQLTKAAPPFEWALAARERTQDIPAVHVLARGNPRSPGAEVGPGFLHAVSGGPAEIPPAIPGTRITSGRRRAFADWIASPENPLTARVLVNRVWHHHFGRGLVRTTSDFGRVGALPSHPELLDWLAGEFIRSGWSLKSLHRLILTSAAWNQSSVATQETALAIDPSNELLWRQNLRRLDAESLWDSLLSISGQLNPESGGRGFFPVLSGEVLAGGSRPGTDWQVSPADQLARRSLYTYIRRTSMVPLLETFDYNNATSPLSERPVTTVAPQALMLLNDAFVQEQAAALARRVADELPDAPEEVQLRRIWALATGRPPNAGDLGRLQESRQRQTALWSGLTERITFRPDVPDTLSVPYFQSLPPSRFLVGPDTGWQSFKGCWPREYEGNRALEAGRGPFALWTGAVVTNGVLELDLVPQSACTQAGILLRAQPPTGDTGETGYELMVEPREHRAVLRQLTPTKTIDVAVAPGVGLTNGHLAVRIELQDDRISVRFHDQPEPGLSARMAPGTPASGSVGIRAWGAAVSLDRLRWTDPKGTTPLWPVRQADWARQKSLESVCLLVMNLNEVLYVD